jgi:hypothetical protein
MNFVRSIPKFAAVISFIGLASYFLGLVFTQGSHYPKGFAVMAAGLLAMPVALIGGLILLVYGVRRNDFSNKKASIMPLAMSAVIVLFCALFLYGISQL